MAFRDILAQFHPYQNEPPSASYASPDTRNQRPALAFVEGGGSDAAIFSAVMPSYFSNRGIKAKHWIGYATGTTGSGQIQGSFESLKPEQDDLDDEGWDTASAGLFAVPANSGSFIEVSIIFPTGGSNANTDGLASGNLFRYRIQRKAEEATDNATGSMQLLYVELTET